MSSNIRIKRVCIYCRKEFTAKTTVTKYCSISCNRKDYKSKIRAKKIDSSNKETNTIKNLPIEQIKAKEFLSISETSQLLGISKRTIYRLFENQELQKIKIGSRTIIKRSSLDQYINTYEENDSVIPLQQIKDLEYWNKSGSFNIDQCYTISEIIKKFNFSEHSIHNLIKKHKIPILRKGWYTYVPKDLFEKSFQ